MLARYDLTRAGSLDRETLITGELSMGRYRALLPVGEKFDSITLGEGATPLVRATHLGSETGLANLFIKDESRNPTGTFKARGLAVAVARAWELGAAEVAIPSAGAAGSAMSAYAARASLQAHVFMPADVPEPFRLECEVFGAEVRLVEGTIADCAREAGEAIESHGWVDLSTLKEPYRLEGKKTMGYELAEQLGWNLPDVVIYPTGGGTGLIGMWKSFAEMADLGWIGQRRPRMVAVQAERCAPLARAFGKGLEFAPAWENPQTIAPGLRAPQAVGDFLVLRALRESQGTAVTVSDEALLAGQRRIAALEGIYTGPEGGATLAALDQLVAQKWVSPSETVVLFNTATGLKYPHISRQPALQPAVLPR